MYREIMRSFLYFSFIVTLLCMQNLHCDDVIDEFLKDQNGLNGQVIETYLKALEKFDRTNSSCEAMTSAINNFFKVVDYKRKYELAALLFVLPKFRPNIFPEVQYKKVYRGRGGIFIERVDVVVFRLDGTLFVFCVAPLSANAAPDKKKDKSDVKSYKGIKGEVHHAVAVNIRWPKVEKGQVPMITTEYLFDSMNYTRTVPVT